MVLLVTFILFAVSLTAQVAIWRVRLPRHQAKALITIFASVFCLWMVYAVIRSVPVFELLHVALFYVSITLGYLITYSAIQWDSPTLSLMRFIAENGDAGRSADELARFVSQRPFVKSRVRSLVDSGLVRDQAGRYVVVGRGSTAFRLILAYRKLYGSIPKGG